MPYGLLTPSMQALIVPLVADKAVWDLGAGDLAYARLLLDLGAQEVVAVDKQWHCRWSTKNTTATLSSPMVRNPAPAPC